jgi:hypothetical protein
VLKKIYYENAERLILKKAYPPLKRN